MSDCVSCTSEPEALSPCPCHHAPCIHDRNAALRAEQQHADELAEALRVFIAKARPYCIRSDVKAAEAALARHDSRKGAG